MPYFSLTKQIKFCCSNYGLSRAVLSHYVFQNHILLCLIVGGKGEGGGQIANFEEKKPQEHYLKTNPPY